MSKNLIINATNLVGKFASFGKNTRFVTIFAGITESGKLLRPWTFIDATSNSKEQAKERLQYEWKESMKTMNSKNELKIFKVFDVNEDTQEGYNEVMIKAHEEAGIKLVEVKLKF